MRLKLKGHEFVIQDNDDAFTCIWKALSSLAEGEAVTGPELFKALEPGHYSEAALRQALSKDKVFVLKEGRITQNNRQGYWYRLNPFPATPFIASTTNKQTKKQKHATWVARNPHARLLKYY